MSKARKNIYYVLALVIPIALAVYLLYKMNAIAAIDPVLRYAGSQTRSVINQALFIFSLQAFGLVLMYCFNKHFSKMKVIMLSFIVGVLTWCLSSVIIVCVGVPFKWYYVALLCIAVLAAAYFTQKPEKPAKNDIAFYAKTLGLYASLALFFAALCVFRFSYDSYMYINTGQKIAKLGYLPKELIKIVSGFPLFTPMLFAPSVFFGYDFSQGVYLLINVQFTVFVGYAAYEHLKDKVSQRKALAAGALTFLAIGSANIYFELTYWPMSNLLTTMTMFGMLYFARQAQEEKQGANMLFSAFFGICFVLTRSENMLLYICFMFIISLGEIEKKHLALHLASVAAALALWYFRFFSVAGFDFTEGAFLTVERAAGVLGVLVLFIIYILFISKSAFVTKRKKLIERMFFLAMVLAIAVIAILNPVNFMENMKATLYNVFYDGGWAGALMLFSAMYFIKLLSQKGFDWFDKQILVFILFFVIIFLLRSMPLRVGFGDSGNRYFAHVLPVLAYSISTALTKKI